MSELQPQLQLLGIALGLAALSGVNLYLTVFAISLALNAGWLELPPSLDPLQFLGHPAILIVSGLLYLVEFVADKVPWFDSAWDLVHTAIRPLGAAVLGVAVLGVHNPVVLVIAGLVCGSLALGTHLTKAGTRLMVNTFPEPFSNTVVSLVEDSVVVAALFFFFVHPLVALIVAVAAAALLVWLVPKMVRLILANGRFIIKKLNFLGFDREEKAAIPLKLPGKARACLAAEVLPAEEPVWAMEVVAGSRSGVPVNSRAWLVALEPSYEVRLLTKRRVSEPVVMAGAEVHVEKKLLFDELVITDAKSGRKLRARFAKDQDGWLKTVRRELGLMRRGGAEPVLPQPSNLRM
jgi:hypothetical protein